MGLSGLAIYKLLPRTNCKECGFPTCLAFAMKLAARQVELTDCPYVSDDGKAALDAASTPPIRLVKVGPEARQVEVGNETVMFRHEKTFYHQPGIFYHISDAQPLEQAHAILQKVAEYAIERVGISLRPDGVAIESTTGDPNTFTDLVSKAVALGLPVILMGAAPEILEAGLKAAQGSLPLLASATATNWEAMAALAKAHGCPLVVAAPDLDGLATLAKQISGAGVQDLILNPQCSDWPCLLGMSTQVRRLALKKNVREVGYPLIAFTGTIAKSQTEETLLAAQCIAKYAGLVVLDHFDQASLYSLLTLRQNIYTDPQKPIQVSPGLYEIGNPGPDSPLLVTTNFSLTYFSVAGEVEASGIPAWLLITDSEGMSVLTAWAAGKFDAERIAKAVKAADIPTKINHRRIIIPGHVSGISGELEEELPSWEIGVGPREAIGIPSYLKQFA